MAEQQQWPLWDMRAWPKLLAALDAAGFKSDGWVYARTVWREDGVHDLSVVSSKPIYRYYADPSGLGAPSHSYEFQTEDEAAEFINKLAPIF